jgi:hypothetical protein
VAGDGGSYWNVSTFGPDTWASMDVPDATTTGTPQIRVYARINTPGATYNAYYCLWQQNTSTLTILRAVGGVSSSALATVTSLPADGHKVGIEVTGTGATVTINCLVHNGTTWSVALTFGDTSSSPARITTAGFVGFRTNVGGLAFDNFRACTVVAGACAAAGPTPRAIIINHRCPFGLCRGERWAQLWRNHP